MSSVQHIDAAINQQCACGCGEVLDPDGPSAWFAGQDCQMRWHSRRTTDPATVYVRRDAANVHLGQDDRPVWLSVDFADFARDGGTESIYVWQGDPSVRFRPLPPSQRDAAGESDQPRQIPYWCPECGHVGSLTEVAPPVVGANRRPEPQLVCTGCARPVPETLTFMVIQGNGVRTLGIRMVGRDGARHEVFRHLSDQVLRMLAHSHEFVRDEWVYMQRQLNHHLQQRQQDRQDVRDARRRLFELSIEAPIPHEQLRELYEGRWPYGERREQGAGR